MFDSMWFFIGLTLLNQLRVEEIKVEGLKRSSYEEVLRISKISKGSIIAEQSIQTAKEELISSELFHHVEVKDENCKAQAPQPCIIKIIVEEKSSWFIFPFFYFSEDSMGGGAIFADANLLGGQEKLFAVGNWGNRNRLGLIAFENPHIGNTAWSFNSLFLGKSEDEFIYIDRRKDSKVKVLEYGGSILPGYHLTDKLRLIAGPAIRRSRAEFERDQTKNYKGTETGAQIDWRYENTRRIEGLSEGIFLSQTNLFSLGDFDFFRQESRLHLQKLFFNDRWASTSKFGVQWGKNLPFHRELTAGGTNLRGYVEKEIRGNMKFSFNQEILFPLYRWNDFILRGIAFHDSQVVYFRSENFSRDNWYNGSGAGLRLYFRKVVMPLMGLDIARGWEAKDWGVYFNIGVPESR